MPPNGAAASIRKPLIPAVPVWMRRAIGAPRLALVPVGDDDDDRSEDLLARDGHVVAFVAEDRGLEEPTPLRVAGTPAARCPSGALIPADGDVFRDLLSLLGADHRTDGGRRDKRGADRRGADPMGDGIEDLVGPCS